MQITMRVYDSLRILLYLTNHSNRRCDRPEIAAYYGMSDTPIRKAIHRLSKSGFIFSFQGRKGGVTLAKTPKEITLLDVISLSEHHTFFPERPQIQRVDHADHALEIALSVAKQSYIDALRSITLADISNDARMRGFLAPENRR